LVASESIVGLAQRGGERSRQGALARLGAAQQDQHQLRHFADQRHTGVALQPALKLPISAGRILQNLLKGFVVLVQPAEFHWRQPRQRILLAMLMQFAGA
jgi:uncharacterized membrane protein